MAQCRTVDTAIFHFTLLDLDATSRVAGVTV